MRCSICNRKIKKMYKTTCECRCGKHFCSIHKFDHKCSFDYKTFNKNTLENKLVKIENNKGLNYIY